MDPLEVERLEVDLLLEGLYRCHGYDFRGFARASIERRARDLAARHDGSTILGLLDRAVHDQRFFSELVQHFSIPVTEMFRDPPVHLALRTLVAPLLRTWPHVKIWHAGCATGEEVYSLAIVLAEEGVLERATIYATDFNDAALERARAGIFAPEVIQAATRAYQEAGGRGSFSDYYRSRYEAVVMDAALRRHITFANHNLATDGVFGEMHLVLCRNVLIYFNRELKERALGLFTDSLVHGGFLCLGRAEGLTGSTLEGAYEVADAGARIYRRVAG